MAKNQSQFCDGFYELKNSRGMSVEFSSYGALIGKICVLDRKGRSIPVTLSLPKVSDYQRQVFYLGAMMGRYAGRIPEGNFTLGGKNYEIIKNNGRHTLHGGDGFDKRYWEMDTFEHEDGRGVRFEIFSSDGDSGFPGNLRVVVFYKLFNESNKLEIRIQAQCDQDTQINLAQHSYFNLNGIHSKIDNHFFTIGSNCHSETDSELMPLGGWVEFSRQMVNERGNFEYSPNNQIWKEIPFEMDHSFLLNRPWEVNARAWSPLSGIELNVKTTQPTLHFYTGNFLPDGDEYLNGCGISKKSGFCFETMRVPNTKEFKDYPTTVLRKDELFDEITSFEFGIVDSYDSFL
jgi:aldose 1-epimerase